jgi:hypothetical protein
MISEITYYLYIHTTNKRRETINSHTDTAVLSNGRAKRQMAREEIKSAYSKYSPL